MHSGAASAVAVIHLVRRVNGLEPLRRFLESCARYPAGAAHERVFVLKGFEQDAAAAAEVARLAGDGTYRAISVPDDGLDLDAYRSAAAALDCGYLCFLNSFSAVMAEGWLAKMLEWAVRPGIGIVGTTASWESVFTDEVDLFTGALKARLTGARRRGAGEPAPGRRERAWRRLWPAYRDFRPFPNPHVRTNAFLLSRRNLAALNWPPTPVKADAYRLESGRESLTAQLMRIGLEPVVVGRDGRAYFRRDWPDSGTFWQGGQENVLVDDNQTREYLDAPTSQRKLLARRAWRGRARP